MSIGARLKEERERLGFTQPAFAGLAETTKKSQIDYEKDLTQPKAGYLAVISRVGADVQYIITGLRSSAALNADTTLIVGKYEQADAETKNKVLMLLLGASEATASDAEKTKNNKNVNKGKNKGVQVGQNIGLVSNKDINF